MIAKPMRVVLILNIMPLLVIVAPTARAGEEPPAPAAEKAQAGPSPVDLDARADKRYDEMLGKMRAAVEEIAQLYGNPLFLQVFTNDDARAAELKLRLRSAQSGVEIRREIDGLERKRDDLSGDIALKKREAARLGEKLVRQRAALDALASAMEQARKAVEDTSR